MNIQKYIYSRWKIEDIFKYILKNVCICFEQPYTS